MSDKRTHVMCRLKLQNECFAFLHQDVQQGCHRAECCQRTCNVLALRRSGSVQILASILGYLDDPSHVAAAAITCKRLRELSKSAPLHLRITPSRFMREDGDGVETLRQDHLRAFLTALCAKFKGDNPLQPSASVKR